MKRRKFLATAAATSVVGLAGCGGGQEQGEVTAEVTLTEEEVFEPQRVHVATGEAVEWTNETDNPRSITANSKVKDSVEYDMEMQLEPGESGVYTFREGGVYSYHDSRKTSFFVCGAVAVGDTTVEDIGTLPCEDGG